PTKAHAILRRERSRTAVPPCGASPRNRDGVPVFLPGWSANGQTPSLRQQVPRNRRSEAPGTRLPQNPPSLTYKVRLAGEMTSAHSPLLNRRPLIRRLRAVEFCCPDPLVQTRRE